MSIAFRTALLRFGRTLLYGFLSWIVAYLMQHLGDFSLPTWAIPLATAALTALDKWVRERTKPS